MQSGELADDPATALGGAFADPPIDAARAFRAVLTALSQPGRVVTLAGAAPPAPLSPAAGALLLALADAEAPVYLAGSHDVRAVRDWLLFHTGARAVERPAAAFAVGSWEALAPLEGYRIGAPDHPDRSATLIVERPGFGGRDAVLSGPGIDGAVRMALPELAALQRNAALFPLGLDLFFTCGARLAALPRSTRIAAAPGLVAPEPG